MDGLTLKYFQVHGFFFFPILMQLHILMISKYLVDEVRIPTFFFQVPCGLNFTVSLQSFVY